jgi:hypothetical protein
MLSIALTSLMIAAFAATQVFASKHKLTATGATPSEPKLENLLKTQLEGFEERGSHRQPRDHSALYVPA